MLILSESTRNVHHFGSLEPRLSVPDCVSQLWRKTKAARHNPERKAWVRGYHFGASPITTVFIVEEIRVIEFYPDLHYSQPPSHICMGCHQQCEDHLKVHGKGSILVQALSQQHNLTGRYGLLFYPYFDIAQTYLTSKPYSSKCIWDVTSNMDIIRKHIECASFWCESHHHCLLC